MWSEADIEIVKQLEGVSEPYCRVRFYCIFKKGNLLLALPKERNLALNTLSLYQPQAWKARGLATGIKLLVKCNLHNRFLPSRSFTFRVEGPIAALKVDDSGFGFLLGNPESKERSVILARKTGGEVVIDKVGLSAPARDSVCNEVSIIRSLPDGLVGLADLRQFEVNDHWSFYSCPLIDGRSPARRHDDLVLSVLQSWFKFAKKKPLIETRQWAKISEYINTHQMNKGNMLLDGGKNLDVMVGICHGDFAPWNIKVAVGGNVVVMDWEYGSCSAPSAWDWMHYLIQRASLVDQLPAADTLQVCRDWAHTAKGKVFMDEAGWGGNIELCLGSYLVYSNALGHFEHLGLLEEWTKE